jgi:sodium/hydrogen antiporter
MVSGVGKKDADEPTELGPIRQGLSRMTTWTGLGGRKDEQNPQASTSEGPREGRKTKDQEDDDDRRIRFTIGGAGRRMTKEDFLKEIQSLDPKTRSKVVNESDAPEVLKDMARKDASPNQEGSRRLYVAKDPEIKVSRKEAAQVGAKMAEDRGADVDDEEMDSEESEGEAAAERRHEESTDAVTAVERHEEAMRELAQSYESPAATPMTSGPASPNLGPVETPPTRVPETTAEQRRRENVLRSLDDDAPPARLSQPQGRAAAAKETPAERRRREASTAAGLSSSAGEIDRAMSPTGETPAEKRRREAALGVGVNVAEEDSDDDNTERVPQARRRPGIRFAEEPIRG